ncbi:MAG: HipA N-terminal domain-containing protein [Chitinispirillaceae bacterium]|nr:HipA N-terminal domain-containing protein [Chitinispirillaceae bacterium]
MRKGRVFYKGEFAGLIEETAEGYQFTYDARYLASPAAQPVSLTLPLGPHPFVTPTLHPFFDGLIPEGWLLKIVVKNWKISERDRMGLLLTVCKDCIGAVSVEGCDE